MILDVKNLSAGYVRQTVFQNINFCLKEHELLSILGPNGSGKTTMLKCINCILKPKKGAVMVEGRDVLRMAPSNIAKKIGYVAQKEEPARLTAFDAIMLGRKPHMGWRVSKKDLKVVDSTIKRLGLENLTLKYIDQMSSGEMQKVSIARALVQEPTVLLLDEPTSNLDLKNQLEILQTIRLVIAEHNVGAIITMHDLNLAMRFSDQFLLLKNGSIYSGGHTDSITPEMIKQVYEVDVKIHKVNGFHFIQPCEKKYGGKFFGKFNNTEAN
jgi:iron complex transport system ATP-binding protein